MLKFFIPIGLLLSFINSYAGVNNEAYKFINNLDKTIEMQKITNGTRIIIQPYNISFDAVLKSYPRKIKSNYVNSIHQMKGFEPLPKINNQIFLETSKGKVFSAYIIDNFANFIKQISKLEQKYRFIGYQIYNYKRGPAYVIEGISNNNKNIIFPSMNDGVYVKDNDPTVEQ